MDDSLAASVVAGAAARELCIVFQAVGTACEEAIVGRCGAAGIIVVGRIGRSGTAEVDFAGSEVAVGL